MTNSTSYQPGTTIGSSLFRQYLKHQSDWDWVLVGQNVFYISPDLSDRLFLNSENGISEDMNLLSENSLLAVNACFAKQDSTSEIEIPIHYEVPGAAGCLHLTRIKQLQTPELTDRMLLGKLCKGEKADKKKFEGKETLNSIFNNFSDAVFVNEVLADYTPGKFIGVNDVACRKLGCTRDELLRLSPLRLVHSIVPRQSIPQISKSLHKDGIITFKGFFTAKTGEKTPFEISARLHLFGESRVCISVARELPASVAIQDGLDDSSRHFEAFMRHLPAIACIRNEQSRFTYVNPSFEKYFGEHLVGKSLKDIFSPDVVAVYEQAAHEVLKYGMTAKEFQLPDRKGKVKTWLIYSFKLPCKDRAPLIGSVGIDISGQKDIEAELIRAKDHAEQMSRLKTALLTNLSHEVRTPMNGIIGFSEIMLDSTSDPGLNHQASLIYNSAVRLMRTLDSMLKLSTLESGTYEYKPQLLKLTDTLSSVPAQYRKLVEEKKLNLTLHFDEDLQVFVDKETIQECFGNLLENAIKFTRVGSVKVTVSTVSMQNKNHAKIEISDTGIGINPEHHHSIFEAFKQVSEGYNREFEGIGLGLTIVQKAVKIMEGTITVESEPGKGSTFAMLIPLVDQLTANSGKPDLKSETSRIPVLHGVECPSVLLIEDNISNIELVQIYLMNKCHLDYCSSVTQALEMSAVKQYHAVLVDINLGPGLDGMELVKRLKEVAAYKYVPVIAVTGLVTKGDQERLEAAGFNDFIPKPFSRADMLDCLARYYPSLTKFS